MKLEVGKKYIIRSKGENPNPILHVEVLKTGVNTGYDCSVIALRTYVDGHQETTSYDPDGRFWGRLRAGPSPQDLVAEYCEPYITYAYVTGYRDSSQLSIESLSLEDIKQNRKAACRESLPIIKIEWDGTTLKTTQLPESGC